LNGKILFHGVVYYRGFCSSYSDGSSIDAKADSGSYAETIY